MRAKAISKIRAKTSLLVQQAQYTLELARKHIYAVKRYGITEEFLNNLEHILNEMQEVYSLMKQPAYAELPARKPRELQQEMAYWVREIELIFQNTFEEENPEMIEMITPSEVMRTVVSRWVAHIEKVLPIITEHKEKLIPWGLTDELIEAGKTLIDEGKSSELSPEEKKQKSTDLAEKLYNLKASIVFKLRKINRAGEAAYLREPQVAAEFNSSLLRSRQTGDQKRSSDSSLSPDFEDEDDGDNESEPADIRAE